MTKIFMVEMKIQYYLTNIGVFFKFDGYYSHSTIAQNNIVEINGKDVTSLVPNNGWYHFEGELKDFKKRNPLKKEQVGWKLINPELASDKIPLTLNMEQLKQVWDSDEDEYTYHGTYASLASLYQADYTELPAEIVPVEVELVKLRDLHIENYEAPSEMKIQVQYGNYGGKLQVQDFEQDRFYYNNEEDFREVLSEVCNQAANLRGTWYNLSPDEEQRVSKFW